MNSKISHDAMPPLACFLLFLSVTCGNAQGQSKDTPASPVVITNAKDAVGAVEGTVVYKEDRKRFWRYRRNYVKDRKKGFLAETVVAVEGVSAPRGDVSRLPEVVLDQKDYLFLPETVAVRAGRRIKFTNADRVLHNVTISGGKQLDSFTINYRQSKTKSFYQAGGIEKPLQLSCKFHSAMRGWIFVFDHPYFLVTGEDGKFRIDNLPAGKYKLKAVHAAGKLHWSREIDIQPGQTTKIEIEVSPDNIVDPAEK